MTEWVKTAVQAPTMQNCNIFGKVIAVCMDWEKPVVGEWRWESVAQNAEKFPFWTTHPKAPEMEDV